MHLILPSNTPAYSFPNNKSSSFTIPLPFTLVTRGWKVGLTQVQFPITFYNVEAHHKIRFETEQGILSTVNLQEGIYENPDQLKDMLNICCADKLLVTWNSGFHLELLHDTKKVILCKQIARMLGVPTEITRNFSSKISTFDPWINIRIILVRCSLTVPSQVNHQQLPVLQAVILQDFTFGHACCRNFHPVDFIEVQGDAHNTITVQLTDLDDEPIRFRSGSVILQLVLQQA